MTRFSLALASAAVIALTGGAALADCRDDLAQMRQGVAKDGAQAPLAGTAVPQAGDGQQAQGMGGAMAPSGGAAKDGTQMPLAANPDVATSADDAQAQQQGGGTAAEVAGGATSGGATAGGAMGGGAMGGGAMGGGAMGGGKAAALDEAQMALDRGDEAACLSALERAGS